MLTPEKPKSVMRLLARLNVCRESIRLAQGFVQNNPDSRSQVETPNVRIEHGYSEAAFPVRMQKAFRQATRFAAENKAIFIAKSPIEVAPLALRAEI
jgi:hypothetical protein